MLNYMDKAGFTLIAGGVLGQFFTSTDTLVRGCSALHNTTGIWTITLPSPIVKPYYLFLSGVLTGYGPGIIVEMTDISSTQKFIFIKDSSTGASIDVDVSWMLFEIPAGG